MMRKMRMNLERRMIRRVRLSADTLVRLSLGAASVVSDSGHEASRSTVNQPRT